MSETTNGERKAAIEPGFKDVVGLSSMAMAAYASFVAETPGEWALVGLLFAAGGEYLLSRIRKMEATDE